MKRRNLLGLLSVIPFAGPALSSTAEPADEWESDVCVIGAGLAGITAAIAAKTAGAANVCVLEKESLLEGHSTISATSARCAICRATTRSTARRSTP